MRLIDTIFADRLRNNPPKRKQFVLEKLQAINEPVSRYRSVYLDNPYNNFILEGIDKQVNEAIVDFVIAAWLTLDCPQRRNPAQIKQRFNDIKWLQQHYENMPGYKAVCFKRDSRRVGHLFRATEYYDYSICLEIVPDYIKGRYEQFAENFILSTPQEQQHFIQKMSTVAHHQDCRPNQPQRQRDE